MFRVIIVFADKHTEWFVTDDLPVTLERIRKDTQGRVVSFIMVMNMAVS